MKKKSQNTPKSRLRLEIKEITEAGTFEGLLSPYGNLDAGGDVVEPGAYAKTLKEHGNKVPLLWQHKTDVPIGELMLDDRKDGLWCKGQLLMTLPAADTAYKVIKARIVKGLSIGFETVKDAIENGVRHLKEIRLYEGSIVTFPMNEMAMITSVKAREGTTKGDFIENLTQYQTLDGYYQMFSALRQAMSDCVWSDLSREDKIAMCSTILQQFGDAFTEFFPNYIDTLATVYGIGMNESYASKRELEEKAVKAGARFSADTKSTLSAACEQIQSGHDEIMALVASEAANGTSKQQAATTAEPDDDHSELKAMLDTIEQSIKS